jgi:hypothetical protein
MDRTRSIVREVMSDASKASSVSTPSPGVVEVSPVAVREAMNGVLADTLRPICLGLALFYAVISSWYVVEWVLLDSDDGSPAIGCRRRLHTRSPR